MKSTGSAKCPKLHHLAQCKFYKAAEKYFTVVLFVFQFTKLEILENLSILDSALSGVKGLSEELWVIQSLLTFDSMDRTPKCGHSLESC